MTRFYSAPAEHPFDVGELQLHIGRPPVIALAGMRGRFHLAQQRVHLIGIEAAPRTHAHMTGQRCRHVIQTLLKRTHRFRLGQLIGEIADQSLGVDLT